MAGNGSQWAGMASELLQSVPAFQKAVYKCADFLSERYNMDLIAEFNSGLGFGKPIPASVGLTAVQIGLVDVLKSMGIVPDLFLGHSAGKSS